MMVVLPLPLLAFCTWKLNGPLAAAAGLMTLSIRGGTQIAAAPAMPIFFSRSRRPRPWSVLSPAMAAKKKSAKKPAAETAVMNTTPANSNENSMKFAKDALPVFLPSWTMPAYLAVQT